MKPLAILAFLFLTACGGFVEDTISILPADIKDYLSPEIENNIDRGGSLWLRLVEVHKEDGDRVEPITGACLSICTIRLYDPDTCVMADAQFGFHRGFIVPGLPDHKWRDEIMRGGDALMLAHYPVGLQRWWLENTRDTAPDRLAYLTGAQLVANGWARACQ